MEAGSFDAPVVDVGGVLRRLPSPIVPQRLTCPALKLNDAKEGSLPPAVACPLPFEAGVSAQI